MARDDCENTELHDVCPVNVDAFDVDFCGSFNRGGCYLQVSSIRCACKVNGVVWGDRHLLVVVVRVCEGGSESMYISCLSCIHENANIRLNLVDS